ncbi:HTH-type transcriptional regulator HdfR [Staphylococcus aureus]
MQNSIKVNPKGGTTLNLNILKSFLVTSETKNLTKASELLNYSQSTVSTHIEKLEKQLDVKLFYRKNMVWN